MIFGLIECFKIFDRIASKLSLSVFFLKYRQIKNVKIHLKNNNSKILFGS